MSSASASAQNPGAVLAQMRVELQRLQEQVRHGGTPKFPKPEPYDGQKGNVRSFLTQAKAYLRVNSAITGPAAQILCIGNLLTGKAFEWWEPTLRDYLDHENDAQRDEETNNIFVSYEAFEQYLKTAFGDPDEERTATRHLKNLRQTGSAMHYNREFRRYASKLELGETALMEYFYDGLREDVKDELSKADKPEEFNDYVEMAIKIDNRNYQRRQERGPKGSRPMRTFVPRANQGKPYRHRSTAYGQHSGPMDLDATARDDRKQKTCYNCGKPGHYANKCHQKKRNWKPVPERKVHVATREQGVDHRTMHFSGCYDDSCLIHKSDKDGANWYPKKPKEKTLAMTDRLPPHSVPAYHGIDAPPYNADLGSWTKVSSNWSSSEETTSQTIPATPDTYEYIQADWEHPTQPYEHPEYYGIEPVQEIDDTSSEEEEDDEDAHPTITGRGTEISQAEELLSTLQMECIEPTQPIDGDPRVSHPNATRHHEMLWFCCIYPSCPFHLWDKLEYKWMPKRMVNGTKLPLPLRKDLWEGYNMLVKGDQGFARLHYQPGTPTLVLPPRTQELFTQQYRESLNNGRSQRIFPTLRFIGGSFTPGNNNTQSTLELEEASQTLVSFRASTAPAVTNSPSQAKNY
jgi:Retrotransposon gag protein/Zinc knuckle